MEIRFDGTFAAWQKHARDLSQRGIAPSEIFWSEQGDQATLFTEQGDLVETAPVSSAIRVPKRFVELAKTVAAFRESRKWRLLYSVLWRITHENHDLLKVQTDDEV